MRKYIDAEELKVFMRTMLTGNDLYRPNGIDEFVDGLPAADVQEVVKEWCNERNCIIVAREDFPRLEVRHGRWEPYLNEGPIVKCSVCGSRYAEPWNYCPNCGSRMDLGVNENE